MPTNWLELHSELTRCRWFNNVGRRTEQDTNALIRPANSWAEAVQWTEADISWWCINEASNMLREVLHSKHNREYQEWNHHITSFGPALDELLAGPVTSALPPEARMPGALEWIRSHLTRAYLECVYSPLHDISLVRNQVMWYSQGHFPCGWLVDEEPAFPSHAMTVVY
jgi:hypothetical protein